MDCLLPLQLQTATIMLSLAIHKVPTFLPGGLIASVYQYQGQDLNWPVYNENVIKFSCISKNKNLEVALSDNHSRKSLLA